MLKLISRRQTHYTSPKILLEKIPILQKDEPLTEDVPHRRQEGTSIKVNRRHRIKTPGMWTRLLCISSVACFLRPICRRPLHHAFSCKRAAYRANRVVGSATGSHRPAQCAGTEHKHGEEAGRYVDNLPQEGLVKSIWQPRFVESKKTTTISAAQGIWDCHSYLANRVTLSHHNDLPDETPFLSKRGQEDMVSSAWRRKLWLRKKKLVIEVLSTS
ncbi:hypothetical protein BD289DRAFT_142424 [Coniella lustricola]|uniref:Uncharacterized protein n=1 Tax=Coniella lustricola TaxID=2025994 RepID=A0A2T2ZV79_9PEZI|nr:hypothetical protein BD289DRAFT_142424 [Coniella lustricola]